MNRVILIGNLTKDVSTRTTQSGTSNCSFTLAVQRKFANKQTGKREADFITIVCWRELADLCARYLAKGKKVAVVGAIQTRTYDAQDGTKRYVTEVVADEVQFLSGSDTGGNSAPERREDTRPSAGSAQDDDDGDELPF